MRLDQVEVNWDSVRQAKATKKACLMWSWSDLGRGGGRGRWKEGGENGSGKQYLDRRVARTKTSAGV